VRVIFAGTPHSAAVALRGLVDASIEIALVVTRPDAPIGRKQIITESPVAAMARELGIDVLKVSKVTAEAEKKIIEARADIGVVVAYGSFLSDDTLALLPNGWVNLHFSLLPKYRGAAPVQHAIKNREAATGVSIFQIDSSMDGGEIYLQVPTEIEPLETSGRLLERLTSLGISALVEVLPQIVAGISQSKTQDESEKSFAPKISRPQAKINWQRTASEIEALICAMNPEPMAWSEHEGSSIRILSAHSVPVNEKETTLEVGKVVLENQTVQVQCAAGSRISLLEVQPAGRNAMSALDWFNGLKKPIGIKFE
jgi:methionyl-tRNA formyltransferase